MTFSHLSFYHFFPIQDVEALAQDIETVCQNHNLVGHLIVSPEGLNGGVAAPDISPWLDFLQTHRVLKSLNMNIRWTHCQKSPYQILTIKKKQQIVALHPDTSLQENAPFAPEHGAAYVTPAQLAIWLKDHTEDTILVDVRNDYEVELGHFAGALNPKTQCFKDFQIWFQNQWQRPKDPESGTVKPIFSPENVQGKKIVTYCTGGIRCEKATAYMLQKAPHLKPYLYQLKGGILNYLQDMQHCPEHRQDFEGEVFVFDGRVALDNRLQPTQRPLCQKCYEPLPSRSVASTWCQSCQDRQAQKQHLGRLKAQRIFEERRRRRQKGFCEQQRAEFFHAPRNRENSTD